MMTALTIAGAVCLVLCIGIRGRMIAEETERAEVAEGALYLHRLSHRLGAAEPRGVNIYPDEDLPSVARGAGILGPADLR
jgi:hypothetical protein